MEAAHAGEQGRSFALVASEVHSLTQCSATAAKEIKVLIDSSVQEVGAGSQLINQAGKTMDDVMSSIQKVSAMLKEIAVASHEQSDDIEQFNLAITQMVEVIQQNAALVEEAAAVSKSMQIQSESLVSAVGVFKLT
ncbi:methyl-accepting chemotaxis protein [Herbaspirillum sp. Sphag1AN]|nr:methyl-accepting chemotaxis protein [Herbaspirillum sp. Sphag1AN]MBB3246256.1 methyl-accepting chemotaxis protein [Herbaspirillum sp. Sphag64]